MVAMEVVIAVVVTLAPLAVILVALLRTIRRRLGYRTDASPPMPWPGTGRGGPQRASDRSPLRPRTPTLAGGAALPVPVDDEPLDDVIARPITTATREIHRRAAG